VARFGWQVFPLERHVVALARSRDAGAKAP
jgi:hypothetical protein